MFKVSPKKVFSSGTDPDFPLITSATWQTVRARFKVLTSIEVGLFYNVDQQLVSEEELKEVLWQV